MLAQSQIRSIESDLASDRFAVLNDGATRLSSLKATSGVQTPDSPQLVLRGAYWNGSASVDLDWKVRNDVTASNASRLAVTEPGGSDRFIVLDSGDIYIPTQDKGIIIKSPNGNCWRITVSNGGAVIATGVSCP